MALTMLIVCMVFTGCVLGHVCSIELHIIMDKLDGIDSKIDKLTKDVSGIERRLNRNIKHNAIGINSLSIRLDKLALKLDDILTGRTNMNELKRHKQKTMEHYQFSDIKNDHGVLKKRFRRQVDTEKNNSTGQENREIHGPFINASDLTDDHSNMSINEDIGNTSNEHPFTESYPEDEMGLLVNDSSYTDAIQSETDLYHTNESWTHYFEIIIGRLDATEETLHTIVEDREFTSKEISRVSKDVERFAEQVSDAVQDLYDFDSLKKGIDDILEYAKRINTSVNIAIDNLSFMNETLKLHVTDTNNMSVGNFSSCSDLLASYNQNGVYNTRYTRLYCDQETDGGGWSVFQRRKDGAETFYRNWTEYRTGFGHLNAEFWLGNENLTMLTRHDNCELLVNMTSHKDFTMYARYSKFRVHSEREGYRLEISGFSGDAEDGLKYHNGMKFSTYDRDNDYNFFEGSCAKSWGSGWWYKNCYESDLNGNYNSNRHGVTWLQIGLKFVEMKLRCP